MKNNIELTEMTPLQSSVRYDILTGKYIGLKLQTWLTVKDYFKFKLSKNDILINIDEEYDYDCFDIIDEFDVETDRAHYNNNR